MSEAIGNYMGNGCAIVDSGRETAVYAREFLEKQNLLSKKSSDAKYDFYVSDNVEEFKTTAGYFLGSSSEFLYSLVDIDSI